MTIKKLWHKISFLGLEEDQEFSHREVVLLNKLVFVATVVIIPVIPIEVIVNGWKLVPYELVILLTSVITLFFNYKKWYALAKTYFLLVAIGYVWFMGIAVGYGSGNELALIAVFIAPSMLFNDIKIIVVLSVITLASFVGLRYVQEVIPPFLDVPLEVRRNFIILFQIVTMIIVFFQIHYFKGINTRFQNLLSAKNEEIAEKNKEIVDSINYAERIQSAYLPPVEVLSLNFPKSFLLFEPKDIVSGDFYWFYTPKKDGASGDESFVIAADCTGHGVPGAIMSVICSNALNDVIVTRGERDTAIILDLVRENVTRILKTKQGSNRKDGMDVAICKINKNSGVVQFTGAHNPLWVLRKDATEIEVIKADKQPVGYFENAFPFTSHKISLNKADRIYMFSDGFQDQFGGDKGKKFKAANMKKLLLENKGEDMTHQRETMHNAFSDWKGDLEQVDDVVLIGIEF